MPRVSEDFRVKTLANAKMRAAELERIAEFENDLYKFLRAAWKYIDPAPFLPGWHLEAIAEHLTAVTKGEIQRLIINQPPRTSKSTLASVAWPAWTWIQNQIGPLSGPHVQFLTSSYAQSLSMRDSVKMRRLVESPWYQKFWGDRFKLTSDQNTKLRFENNKGGYRLSTSVDGTTTGEGGSVIIVDDAMAANEMSDVVRLNCLQWWDEVMSTRLNDQNTGAYVVIMQRLHQEDLTGHIRLREIDDWTWLMLPMEYDPGRHCVTYLKGEKFWEDPRTVDGELLCPERFNTEIVDNLKRRLGPYGAAGQLNQCPVPRGGGIIQEEWWQHWVNPIDPREPPTYPKIDFLLASLDTAYTEKEENDASALTIWGVFRDENGNPRLILVYGWQDRLTLNDLVTKVIDTCTVDQRENTTAKRRFPVDRLLIESKASGLSVYQELRRTIGISGKFGIELFNPSKQGDKVARVYSIQHLFSEKMVYVPFVEPHGFSWANEIIEQISVFPRGSHDDYVDSMSQALRYLRDMNFALLREEHDMDLSEQMRYSPKLTALYPA